MKVIHLQRCAVQPITRFASVSAWSSELAAGHGEAHLHVVRMHAGGEIGPHAAGFGQLFVVISGVGWLAGPDGARTVLEAGQAAHVARGTVHSKGAVSDVTALIVQVRDMAVCEAEWTGTPRR